MFLTFYGAVREVTGSMHLLSHGNDRILLDCGMFQGKRKQSNEKNRLMPFYPGILTNIILSHAHIDHSGRIPMITREDFHGRIICTRATADACTYLLPDSAHIQESDAAYLNYKTVRSALSRMRIPENNRQITLREARDVKKILKKGGHRLDTAVIEDLIRKYRLEPVEPLYTVGEAERALDFFDGYPYGHPVSIGNRITATLYEAGHIIGSAFTVICMRGEDRTRRILYTGDVGRFNKPIIKDPCLQFAPEDRDIDLMVMESTYGDRLHEPAEDLKGKLADAIMETSGRSGALLIPSFAFGRAQELIYMLHELYAERVVPRLPVYIDSPLATRLTRVFGEHPEIYDRDAHETFLQKGLNPFVFPEINFTASVDESMKLMKEKRSHIVIASSGMCEAGRILHHLRYKIHDEKNIILIVGYMARHTLGRRLLENGLAYEEAGRNGPAPVLRFLNKEYPLHARVRRIGGFSGHGDRNELLRIVRESNLRIKRIALVHGEEQQSLAFADTLRREGFSVTVPQYGETVSIL